MTTPPTGNAPVSYETYQELLQEHQRVCEILNHRNEAIIQLRLQLEEQSQAFSQVTSGLANRQVQRECQVKRLRFWTRAAKIGTVCLGVIAVVGCAVAGLAVVAVAASKS